MSHTINVCKHGTVISRCKCPGPHVTRLSACSHSCPKDDEVLLVSSKTRESVVLTYEDLKMLYDKVKESAKA